MAVPVPPTLEARARLSELAADLESRRDLPDATRFHLRERVLDLATLIDIAEENPPRAGKSALATVRHFAEQLAPRIIRLAVERAAQGIYA